MDEQPLRWQSYVRARRAHSQRSLHCQLGIDVVVSGAACSEVRITEQPGSATRTVEGVPSAPDARPI